MSDNRSNYLKKWKKRVIGTAVCLSSLYTVMKGIAKKYDESDCMDQDNPYISAGGHRCRNNKLLKQNVYESRIKPFLDRLLSFMALVLLSPMFAAIAAAVYIDDPGPVLFTQTRVGKNKRFFGLGKEMLGS